MCWTPFLSGGLNGPTERAQIKSYLMEMDITVDGGGHLLRTHTLLLCRGMCQKVVVRADLAGEAQDSGCTQTRVFTEERDERS